MGSQPVEPVPTNAVKVKPSGLTIAGLVIGLVNLGAWLVPLAGIPLGVLSILLSYLGLQSSTNRLAKICILISMAGLVLTVGNVLWTILFNSQTAFLQMQSITNGSGGN